MSIKLQQIDPFRWRVPREGRMQVEGLVYADERLVGDIRSDQSLQQVSARCQVPRATCLVPH